MNKNPHSESAGIGEKGMFRKHKKERSFLDEILSYTNQIRKSIDKAARKDMLPENTEFLHILSNRVGLIESLAYAMDEALCARDREMVMTLNKLIEQVNSKIAIGLNNFGKSLPGNK